MGASSPPAAGANPDSMDSEVDDKFKQDLDMMEGLGSTFANPNDSFDRIFNKELDLEIGKLSQ